MTILANHNDMLKQYGLEIGLENLSFNDDGEAVLVFDDIFVRFMYDEPKQMILLTSPVVYEAITHDADVYASLLELNLVGILNGAGSVGLDREMNVLTFAHNISLIGLDQNRFNQFVDSCVDLIDSWRKLISSESFPKTTQEAPSLTQTDDTDNIVTTRV